MFISKPRLALMGLRTGNLDNIDVGVGTATFLPDAAPDNKVRRATISNPTRYNEMPCAHNSD